MKRIIVFGAGGHGKVVADTALEAGISDISFLDDKYSAIDSVEQFPVVGRFSDFSRFRGQHTGFIVAVGDNRTRIMLLNQLRQADCLIATIIHPRAFVSRSADIGPGTVVFAQAAVNAGARLGLGVIINTAATVDHDCLLGDGVHISPGAHLGGSVSIGECTWIGVGAVIINNVSVGGYSIVGAGAAITKAVPDNVTVVGVPGRVIKKHE